MDDSFSIASTSKFPSGDPGSEWTVEQLLHWSLDQYHNKAIEQTAQNIASLRNQCEKECEDVMTLHSTAVEMASKGENSSSNNNGAGEENINPQSEDTIAEEGGAGKECGEGAKPTSSSSSAAAASAAAGGAKSASSSSTTIEIQITVGPHSGCKYLLRPKLGQPCLVGRSKGKKFVKNGVSLHKDQEVSTTHGKFVVEGGGLGEGGEGPKFYFIDVGSTNGTHYKGDLLEPNARLLLEDGMELMVGHSALKIVLG